MLRSATTRRPYAPGHGYRRPPPGAPVTTISDVIARLQAIDLALPASDGIACFNRKYLEVTQAVGDQVAQGTFGDPAWVSHLDVVFANRYLAAVDSLAGPSATITPLRS